MQQDNDYRFNPMHLWKVPHLERTKNQLKSGTRYIIRLYATSNRYPLFLYIPTNKLIGGKYHVLCSQNELSDIYKAIYQHAQQAGYSDTKNGMYMSSPNPIPDSLYDGIPKSCWAYAYEVGSRVQRDERQIEALWIKGRHIGKSPLENSAT